VTVSLLLFFIPINHLTILSSIAVAGGLYFFGAGFHLLARKRLLLATPTSRIGSAALGLVEVNGMAAGPHTMPAPITGKPCFLYHATVWQQRQGRSRDWEKLVDETLHLPFFIADSTGQLLVEPLGADLDLLRDFREEYDASFFSSNLDDLPPCVRSFLSRHGIVPARSLRIEERLIKPGDATFIAGTIAENPGIEVRPYSPREASRRDASRNDRQSPALDNSPEQPQIIRLVPGAAPSTAQQMSQQAKIAAALTRAGITKPEAWAAAGVPYQPIAVEENPPPAALTAASELRLHEDQTASSDFNLTPPVVLMKGANDPTFVISFRSQKEFVAALALKSAAMIWGGAAITLLGVYVLLAQMAWV
jgi:hypothetical protein